MAGAGDTQSWVLDTSYSVSSADSSRSPPDGPKFSTIEFGATTNSFPAFAR